MTSVRGHRSRPIGKRKLESKEWESIGCLACRVVLVEARGGGSFGSGLSSLKGMCVERAQKRARCRASNFRAYKVYGERTKIRTSKRPYTGGNNYREVCFMGGHNLAFIGVMSKQSLFPTLIKATEFTGRKTSSLFSSPFARLLTPPISVRVYVELRVGSRHYNKQLKFKHEDPYLLKAVCHLFALQNLTGENYTSCKAAI